MNYPSRILLTVSLFLAASKLPAEVKPNALFADHMVLQQKMAVPVWGTAKEGEKVTVHFAGQSVTTTAKDGQWMVRLKPLTANAKPEVLTVTGENTMTINDVLVGEVWICSGQSNMERHLGPQGGQKPIDNVDQEVANADHPTIRHFLVPRKQALQPEKEVSGQWLVCSPATVQDFTAVGYFFARDLEAVLHVPIGLIHSSVGGTPAEAWTRREVFDESPEVHASWDLFQKSVAAYPALLEKYRKDEPELMRKYEAAVQQAQAENKPAPRKPAPPRNPVVNNAGAPTVLYNGMIAPLEPYAMRGVIWYQGEANSGRAKLYEPLFSAMIKDWRKAWGEGQFPFLFVQIAPFHSIAPELREAQLQTWKHVPNTAMAVITDSGVADDIHPPHKQAVGARLALAAEALAYGMKLEYSGPEYESMKVEGDHAVVSFTHLDGGLMAKDGELKGFTIAGADGNFLPAVAKIESDHVVVTSEQVPQPKAVRYGWSNVPDVNLFNKAGLPASPFTTED